jgi:hypothetical protein
MDYQVPFYSVDSFVEGAFDDVVCFETYDEAHDYAERIASELERDTEIKEALVYVTEHYCSDGEFCECATWADAQTCFYDKEGIFTSH